jgi:hypothetical protein
MNADSPAPLWRILAAFAIGPAAWAVHQQVQFMLVSDSCQRWTMVLPLLTTIAGAAVLIGAYFSLSAWRALSQHKPQGSHASQTRRFLSGLSLLMATLFLFAILLQGAATLLLDGCQR